MLGRRREGGTEAKKEEGKDVIEIHKELARCVAYTHRHIWLFARVKLKPKSITGK